MLEDSWHISRGKTEFTRAEQNMGDGSMLKKTHVVLPLIWRPLAKGDAQPMGHPTTVILAERF